MEIRFPFFFYNIFNRSLCLLHTVRLFSPKPTSDIIVFSLICMGRFVTIWTFLD